MCITVMQFWGCCLPGHFIIIVFAAVAAWSPPSSLNPPLISSSARCGSNTSVSPTDRHIGGGREAGENGVQGGEAHNYVHGTHHFVMD